MISEGLVADNAIFGLGVHVSSGILLVTVSLTAANADTADMRYSQDQVRLQEVVSALGMRKICPRTKIDHQQSLNSSTTPL